MLIPRLVTGFKEQAKVPVKFSRLVAGTFAICVQKDLSLRKLIPKKVTPSLGDLLRKSPITDRNQPYVAYSLPSRFGHFPHAPSVVRKSDFVRCE